MRAPLRVRSQSSRPSPRQLCSSTSARRHLHFLGASASRTLTFIRPLTRVKQGRRARSHECGTVSLDDPPGLGVSTPRPPLFLYLFILRNFKSFNLATADCKALSDRNLTSAHSKGLADFNGRQTAASPSAAPYQKQDYPSLYPALLRVLRVF